MFIMVLSSRLRHNLLFFLSITSLVLCGVSRNASASTGVGCIPLSEDATILAQLKNAVLDPLDSLSTWQLHSAPATNVSCTASASAEANYNNSCAYRNSSTDKYQLPWLGVTCGPLHGRITALLLPSMNLSGPFPAAAITRLKFLRVLNLSYNSFHGRFPADLANCTHLQILDLSGNAELGGSIPREWGGLSRLQELVVEDTSLSGNIPIELANCSELVEFDLSYSQLLSGSIPAELGGLSKMQYLDLAITPRLTGGIPASLANCSALIDLSLQLSGLSGRIPPELGRLAGQLQVLKLFRNSLTGEIPAALANCSLLSTIQLGENELSGHIPPELGRLTGLLNLNIGGNYLVGNIPSSLGNCSALQKIGIYENQLTGRIPSALWMLPLVILNAYSNSLTGELSSIANLTSLVVLDLSFNQLNGTLQFLNQFRPSPTFFYLHLGGNLLRGQIPDVFDRFTALEVLGLNSLPASAPQPLPRSLRSLQSLTHLFLDTSNFQGSIPNNLITSLQMIQLYVSSNNLSGTIPGSLGAFPGLSVLDLSHNWLSGEVPLELGSLFQLQYLNVSSNNLSGRLPPTLASCAQLISLNVSANQLSGPLMPLPNMTALNILDLSYNNFTGPIPDALPFSNTSSTTTAILLNGNPGLCGTLVHRECRSAPSPARLATSDKHTHTRISAIKLVGIVLGTILLALLLATFCFIQLKKRQHSKRCHTSDIKHPAGIHLIHTSAYTELTEATGGFNADHILGMGAVSTVYHAILSTGKAVAVKVFNNEMAVANETAFKKEVAILAKLRHRNIVRVWGCCFTLELKAILLELMPNGSLDQHLYNYGSTSNSPVQTYQALTGMQKLRILKGVAQGLEYLHHGHPDGPIVHCDLKPCNILLDASFEACIADFGIATMLKEAACDESVTHLLRGSVGYIPPEYGYKEDVSTKGDVYSYGVVMLEVFTCKSPTSAEVVEDGQTYLSWVKKNYFNGEYFSNLNIDISASTSSKLFRIAMLCMQDSPFDCPTMFDAYRMIQDLCHAEETK